MLNIGRMAPGSQRYYLEVVASAVDDYYLGKGEAPGRWLGRGIEAVGLDGQVTSEQLNAVLAGLDPSTDEHLAKNSARRVPGFDLTFRPAKSVSLLWALGDTQTATTVQRAHDRAVAQAIDYLEREAGRTRRGAQGREIVPIDGFIGAAFRHRTSREGDPLLHTHVLVANLARTSDDGIWRTLDSRRLYAHAKTAGYLYQAQLRHELTRELGVEWGPVVNGMADLAHVDRSWIEAFSQRRAQIVAHMAQRGEHSPKAAQASTLATRRGKEDQADELTLRERWRLRADELEIDPATWSRLLGRAELATPDVAILAKDLLGPEGLTEQTSTFSRRDVLRAVAQVMPTGSAIERIESIADGIIVDGRASNEVVRLGPRRGQLVEVIRREDGRVVPTDEGEPRFTTAELLELERRTIEAAAARSDDGLHVTPERVQPAIDRRPSLGDEQVEMVTRLCMDGAGVSVVMGKAGTGKTFALDAAREAWGAEGLTVTGTALAARAAVELQESAGIPSTTLARLLNQLDREDQTGEPGPLRRGRHVLVVDEAGMIGTRQLARLLDHAERRDVKVVLVGDPHQLPEIDAGGLFRALATRLDAVELKDNRRQRSEWEIAALDDLRDGDVGRAVDQYREHGRVVTGETAEAVREQLVSDWWQTRQHLAADQTIMVAVRRSDVEDLNQRARERLDAAGLLTGEPVSVDGRDFLVGDRIVCLRNARNLGVCNGTTATIRGFDDLGVDLVLDNGDRGWLSHRYLQDGHVTHGYAITGHKAQGLTVDHTFVLGSDELYREWGYVAMSRGRESNRLYLTEAATLIEDGPHVDHQDTDAITRLGRNLQRSRAELPLTDDLAARWRELDAFLNDPQIRNLGATRTALADRVKSRGSVTRQLQRLDDQKAEWRGPALRGRKRDERDQLLREVDRHADRRTWLDKDITHLEAQLQDAPTKQTVTALRVEHRDLDRQIHHLAEIRAAADEQATPSYLVTTIGTPPAGEAGLDRWRRQATVIEDHRLRWSIDHREAPFGLGQRDQAENLAHVRAVGELARIQREVERPLERDRGLSLGINL